MRIRLFKVVGGGFTVWVKHARRLKIRSRVLFCKDRAAVSKLVEAEAKLEEQLTGPLSQQVF